MSRSALDARRIKVTPVRNPCADCGSQGLCLPHKIRPEYLQRLYAAIRTTWSYRRGEHIYRMGDPFNALFLVKSGSVKTQQVTVDGTVNITGLYFSGDLFGLDAIGSMTYPSESVAAKRTTLCIIPFDQFEDFCAEIPGIRSWLLAQLGERLKTQETISTWRVRKHIEIRALSFFWELYQRMSLREHSEEGFVALPVPKCDFAGYMDMTPETFSRTLAVLCSRGWLEIHSERFRLPDVDMVRGLVGK